jgi:hypothetical protein
VIDQLRKSWPGAVAALTLAAVIVLAAHPTRAQGTQPATPKPPAVLLKVDVVLSRFQGEKKIGSLPYVLWLSSNSGNVSVRMGADVPVGSTAVTSSRADPTGPAGGPNGSKTTSETTTKIEYRYVGTMIDAYASPTEDGRYSLQVNIQDSSIYTADGDAKPTIKASEPMAFRTFSMGNRLVMRDGQTQQYTLATDKISGETLKVDVTLAVQK